jgi:polyferredoxin
MKYTGIYDFFSLALTVGFFLFAALLALSVLIYRPVCRILCPFGVLFSLAGHFSRNLLVRTEACINCKKCEKASCSLLIKGSIQAGMISLREVHENLSGQRYISI